MELLTRVLPNLVGDALATIYRPDKPTGVLDVLPARGKEARNKADDLLNEPVMEVVSRRQCIPTLGGRCDTQPAPDSIRGTSSLKSWNSGHPSARP